jgi:DNA-binding response OmpR family regulator
MNILIIDDEAEFLEKLSLVLTKENYRVDTAVDGRQALDKIWDDRYDLILLDIMLPYIDGLQILKEMRDAEIDTPVLMLTAKGDVEDKVAGLNMGADDYLGKPFSIAELLARIRVLIRRRYNENPEIQVGEIVLDSAARQVFKDGTPLNLTQKEFSILEFLLHNRGRAVSRYTLAEHVWGDDFDPFSMSNFIDVHISNLRRKISESDKESLIVTVRGFGYRIEN